MKTIIKIVTFLLPSCTLFAQANIETVNASTSANAIAVKGTMSSTSSGTYSSSVRGENKSLNNNGYGVWGSHDGTGRGVYGVATGSGQGIGLVGESINGGQFKY
jgi:trimeric autotransporter adhesin